MVISLATQKEWNIFQLDVNSVFLHGELSEKVFVAQPPGYVVKGEEDKVYKLKKALYGLRQSPRAWYSPIEAYFSKEGFLRCPYEHTLFVKMGGEMFNKFKSSMMQEFDMIDLGQIKYFLGIEMK